MLEAGADHNMTGSFSVSGKQGLAHCETGTGRRVLVTGAAGRIGSYFARHTEGKYDLRLMVQKPGDETDIVDLGEIVFADLSDLDALKRHCAGMDTVVHMAGNASAEATWGQLLGPNIIGVYNIMAAAKAAGCRRLIFASSIHAVSGGREDVQVKTSEPVMPGDLYGVTKCFGEALGRYMAEQEGLSVIALRIGAFQTLEAASQEYSKGMMDGYVSERDLNQLLHRCIDATNLKFAIFHGLSNNRFNRLDISDARELVGYDPQDDVTELNPLLKGLRLRETMYNHNLLSGQKSGLRDDV